VHHKSRNVDFLEILGEVGFRERLEAVIVGLCTARHSWSLLVTAHVSFAHMIDRHWDGIAAYCRPENKVSLGFVEGLNNKIRVFQRRAYGLRDEEYLRLKVLTCMLPPL
jgi:hypothetical protein